jgi:tRNA-2-methylthio-N6-dimethylallyladenosine synthase
MFKYSPRERTKAWKMDDDVPDDVKTRRLDEIITLQQGIAYEINQAAIDSVEHVLVENPNRRNAAEWVGRTDGNKLVIFPHSTNERGSVASDFVVGDTVRVRITRATSATLIGELV